MSILQRSFRFSMIMDSEDSGGTNLLSTTDPFHNPPPL